MPELALRGLLGEGAPLSSSSIGRLKAHWQTEYEEWNTQDLSSVRIVYQWADGLYVKAGIAHDKAALLVMVGAKTDGSKVVLCCRARAARKRANRGRKCCETCKDED